MGGGRDCNALTIRIGYEILVRHSSHLLIVKDIADAIKKEVEPTRAIPEEAKKCFMREGDGYADDFGQMTIFEQDPDKLKEMIKDKKALARRNFEAFDLDGNVEEPKKKR